MQLAPALLTSVEVAVSYHTSGCIGSTLVAARTEPSSPYTWPGDKRLISIACSFTWPYHSTNVYSLRSMRCHCTKPTLMLVPSLACAWLRVVGLASLAWLASTLGLGSKAWHCRLACARLFADGLAFHSWHGRLACARLHVVGLASLLALCARLRVVGLASLLAWPPRLRSAACCWPRLALALALSFHARPGLGVPCLHASFADRVIPHRSHVRCSLLA